MRALFLIACVPALAQIDGPRLGLIAHGAQVRPILGVKGAATLGDALAPGRDLAVIAAALHYALASDASTGEVLLISERAVALVDAALFPDRIAMSPGGSAAALWFAGPAHFQIVTGLPANPSTRTVDASFLGEVKEFAVSDEGRIAGAWDAGAYIFSKEGSPAPLPVDDTITALAFFPHRSGLAIATPNRLLSLVDPDGNPVITTLYEFTGNAAGISVSSDYRRAVLAASDGLLYSIDLSSQSAAIVDCDCAPDSIAATGDSLFQLAGNPAKMFDASSNRVFSIPAAAAPDPLSITTATFSIFTGQAFTGTLAATGGTPPYAWSALSGKLPTGLQLAADGTITGTATGEVFAPPVIAVTDSTGARATRSITFLAFTASAPPISIEMPSTAGFAQAVTVSVRMASPFAGDVNGTLTLAFKSSAGADDPAIQFSTGGRSVSFTIPAGSTQATIAGKNDLTISTGTLAGAITLTATVTSPADAAPPPATATITSAATAPAIDSVTLSQTSGGLTVVVTGYTPTREISSGAFSFTAGGNATLAQSTITVPLAPAFSAWFGSAASAPFGGAFTLTVPFIVQGNASNVVRVAVNLTNGPGVSSVVSSK